MAVLPSSLFSCWYDDDDDECHSQYLTALAVKLLLYTNADVQVLADYNHTPIWEFETWWWHVVSLNYRFRVSTASTVLLPAEIISWCQICGIRRLSGDMWLCDRILIVVTVWPLYIVCSTGTIWNALTYSPLAQFCHLLLPRRWHKARLVLCTTTCCCCRPHTLSYLHH